MPGRRPFAVRSRADLSSAETANAVGLSAESIDAAEAASRLPMTMQQSRRVACLLRAAFPATDPRRFA
jgi:DNA-binding XRE family transcriptional regulator